MSKILKILILTIIAIGYLYFNLLNNSVYYAKNMPHSETSEPEIVMLVENMNYLSIKDTENVKFDLRKSTITVKVGEKQAMLSSNVDKLEYLYFRYLDENKHDIGGYYFSIDMVLTKIENNDSSIHNVDRNQVVNEIKTALSPTIDELIKLEPIINLQWVFNLLYSSEYN